MIYLKSATLNRFLITSGIHGGDRQFLS